MNETRFSLEAAALELFVIGAAVNTRRLEGGIKFEQASILLVAIARACWAKLSDGNSFAVNSISGPLDLDKESAIETLFLRQEEYGREENFEAARKQIPRLFAHFCAVPDPNEELLRIGWAIFVGRGTEYVNMLKGLKIV